jgi:hypothetical protein
MSPPPYGSLNRHLVWEDVVERRVEVALDLAATRIQLRGEPRIGLRRLEAVGL